MKLRNPSVYVLKREILVVAVPTIVGWMAYIDAVPGRNHGEEWELVARYGSELQEELARIIFPEFNEVPYGR